MTVIGLDNKSYDINLARYKKPRNSCSKNHSMARELLKSMFAGFNILEEVPLFGTSPLLYSDFFIVEIRTIIEVNGEQHYKFNPHFHSSKGEFSRAQRNDKLKKLWCEINDFNLITLAYNDPEWKQTIQSQLK